MLGSQRRVSLAVPCGIVLPSGTGVLNSSVTQQDRMPKQPDCKWAQRPDKIMLTLNVANLDPAKADIKVQMCANRSKNVKWDFMKLKNVPSKNVPSVERPS